MGKEIEIIKLLANIAILNERSNMLWIDEIGEYEVSPNGKYSAFVIHGEIFITENDKKKSLTKNLR